MNPNIPESHPDNTNSRRPKMSLNDAREFFRLQVSQYRTVRRNKFIGLTRVCRAVYILKQAFMETPKEKRPVKNWTEFGPQEILDSGLEVDCETVRMADNYAKLGEDIKKVDFSEIQKRVSEGSYREVRDVVDTLLNKSTKRTPKSRSPEMLLAKADRAVCAAMVACKGRFPSLDIGFKYKSAAQAYAACDEDVVPELTELKNLGLPDDVRQCINVEVRAADFSRAEAGLRAFERGSYQALGNGGVAFEHWTTGGAVDEARLSRDRQTLLANWMRMRQVLYSALVREFASAAKRPDENKPDQNAA